MEVGEFRVKFPFWWQPYLWLFNAFNKNGMLGTCFEDDETADDIAVEFVLRHSYIQAKLSDGRWVTLDK